MRRQREEAGSTGVRLWAGSSRRRTCLLARNRLDGRRGVCRAFVRIRRLRSGTHGVYLTIRGVGDPNELLAIVVQEDYARDRGGRI